ncbi:hypothetical protein G6011_07326 [Alternaria panax]|uniref:DUF6604 domain-containing protein n=1 Tax=Alternaria panax TaxID=48097 RepID=A0AAD4I911_9PLEO|nr:hypothetical protein G6011_07326 [Alternaria panax]
MELPSNVEYNRSEYKRDTKHIAGHLLKTSRKCGYRPKPLDGLKRYDIHERDFEPMVQCIVDHSQWSPIPAFIRTIFSCDQSADKQHEQFVLRLQRTLDIPRVHIPKPKDKHVKRANASPRITALDIGLKKLNLHDAIDADADADDKEPLAMESNFSVNVKAFLMEMQNVRSYILERWVGESDLMTKALVTNTAIDIVRQKEYELDEILSRPPQYPANEFPVWCLPALLLYREADMKRYEYKFTRERFIHPSRLFPPIDKGQSAQSLLCFYPLYNGLKLLLYEIEFADTDDPKALVLAHGYRERCKHRALHPNVLDALDKASTLHVLDEKETILVHVVEDEVTRSIRHMYEERELPFWVAFAIQILLDANNIPEESSKDPLDEVRRELTKTSVLYHEM